MDLVRPLVFQDHLLTLKPKPHSPRKQEQLSLDLSQSLLELTLEPPTRQLSLLSLMNLRVLLSLTQLMELYSATSHKPYLELSQDLAQPLVSPLMTFSKKFPEKSQPPLIKLTLHWLPVLLSQPSWESMSVTLTSSSLTVTLSSVSQLVLPSGTSSGILQDFQDTLLKRCRLLKLKSQLCSCNDRIKSNIQ